MKKELAYFIDYANEKDPELLKTIREKRALDEDLEERMTTVLKAYVKEIESQRPDEDEDEEEGFQAGQDALEGATSKKKEGEKEKEEAS